MTDAYYIVDSDKPFVRAVADLEAAIGRRRFGVLHVHDMGATLRGKGLAFEGECKVLEVCQPQQAAKVLAADLRLNMALPCRVSVYTEGGRTRIGMLRPARMLEALSDARAAGAAAREVEETLALAIDEAR
jgi:uncharacterized protein (DUF302 family)